MGRLLSRMTAPGALAQVRHVRPVRPGAARGLVARVYAQVERDFGMLAPPVALHSPAPPALAACWMLLRESLLVAGASGRVDREAVATGVSAGNACPYCVDVHAATLRALSSGPLPSVAAWARTTATRATATPLEGVAGTELVAVVVAFQYLNRMVNVFLGESPLPSGRARGPAMRVFGALMAPAARRTAIPGESLGLLPAAPLPGDLAWTAAVPALGEAFARAAAAIEEGGARRLPGRVRELVAERVAAWDGRPPGLGNGWAADAVAVLPPGERPAARLALLTALASHQVDRRAVEEFAAAVPGEAALVEVTSWASLSAARRVGAWCAPAPVRTESTAK